MLLHPLVIYSPFPASILSIATWFLQIRQDREAEDVVDIVFRLVGQGYRLQGSTGIYPARLSLELRTSYHFVRGSRVCFVSVAHSHSSWLPFAASARGEPAQLPVVTFCRFRRLTQTQTHSTHF